VKNKTSYSVRVRNKYNYETKNKPIILYNEFCDKGYIRNGNNISLAQVDHVALHAECRSPAGNKRCERYLKHIAAQD